MSNSNVINEKKKALLAYKENILDDIKHIERSIDDFRANQKNKCFYGDHADSSDSEDDFATAIDMGPSITQLKLQQAMMKTCLHATQELTSLMVLQSQVDVLVEEPKFERERPVTEAGTWREVTAECRIDLVPFTMTFFMHTPDRRFAPPSYRGLRVVPVKSAHELELSKSVLHSLKLPSDAVEVLRSYAVGYRSRRTTLARLANKYTNALFMEPHAEGGFVLKCADLLEVSWRLENKWSPVAPFHHRMKFDLEFMEESYIKIITQAHKQLLDPAIQTDERTLLLAKIITSCLEARGTIDPESDLESKTTERDNDIDKRDSESEKRDSEVMAPPKSLPKKGKQKNKDSLPNTAQKRSMDDDNRDAGAKKMKNDNPEAKKSIVGANNARKSKMSDVVNEGGKKRKMNDVNKVANSKNVKEVGNIEVDNAKTKNVKETEDKTVNIKHKNNKETKDKTGNTKPENNKETEDETGNTKHKNNKETKDKTGNTKHKNNKETEDKTGNNKPKNNKETEDKTDNTKPKNNKETEDKTGNTKPKNDKESENNAKPKNVEDKTANSNSKPKNMKESASTKNKNTKIKNKDAKEAGDNATKDINSKPKTNVLKKPAYIDSNAKSKNKIVKETGNNQEEDDSEKPAEENVKEVQNKATNKEPIKAGKVKNANNKAKNITTKEIGDLEEDKQKENNVKTKNIEKKKLKSVANAKIKEITKETGNPNENNDNENNVNTNNIEKKKLKKVANTESKENIDANKDAGRPKSKIIEKSTNSVKNIEINLHKNENKAKNTDTNKVKNVTNTKNDEQSTKKDAQSNTNVASTKNDGQVKKASENSIKNKEKVPELANKGSEKTSNEKIAKNNVKKDAQTVKQVTEKNSTNIRNKEKISQITKVTGKTVKDKPTHIKDVPEKVLSSNLITKKTKITKNIIKKPITHKIASHRNSLKPQNPPKILKASNTKTITTGNTEKENGGKGSKIPQKTLSIISEGSSKKNILRISPRKIPSKFKTHSQETFIQKMVKSTNIPRLLKKPAPKTT